MSKPKIYKLLDDYAIESGDHWVCSFGGVCARGKTPEESYNKLQAHFKSLSSRIAPSLTRMFA